MLVVDIFCQDFKGNWVYFWRWLVSLVSIIVDYYLQTIFLIDGKRNLKSYEKFRANKLLE